MNTVIKKKPKIIIVVARGEVIRNFLYSRTLDVLSKHAEITVLSVECGEQITAPFRDKCKRIVPLEVFQEHHLVQRIRNLIELSHEHYLQSAQVHHRRRKRAARFSKPVDRLKWGIKGNISRLFSGQVGLKFLGQMEKLVSNMLEPANNFEDLFKEIQPDLVFNGSHLHAHPSYLPMQTAVRMGIKTAVFVFSWDNLAGRGRIYQPYDHFLTWNEGMRDTLLDMYPCFLPEQITVTGTPQFDYHFDPEFFWTREEFCSRVGADPSRPIIFYSTGQEYYMPEEPRIVHGIASMIRNKTTFKGAQLLVRIYPKDTSGRFDNLKKQFPDVIVPKVSWETKWQTPHYDDLALLTNTLRHSAVGINVASTVSLELAIMDKPVINVAYNPPEVDVWPVDYAEYYGFDHYKQVVESKAVQVAYSEKQLGKLLAKALDKPDLHASQRQDFIKKFFGSCLDGHSGERAAQCLLGLAGAGNKKFL